eukprot:COSAG01_NODE_773_length_13704_cov_9.386843_8_plen_57_part_00
MPTSLTAGVLLCQGAPCVGSKLYRPNLLEQNVLKIMKKSAIRSNVQISTIYTGTCS